MFDSFNVRGDKDYANVVQFFLRTVTFWPFKGLPAFGGAGGDQGSAFKGIGPKGGLKRLNIEH